MFGRQLVSSKAADTEETRRCDASAEEDHRAAAPAGSPAAGAETPAVTGCRRCAALADHDSWNADMRHEMPLQRADRAYGEILQEVRVAQTGVQILFAFLLTLAFTARFKSITPVQRDIYVVTLMLAAAATALLIAPAAFHRMIYRRRLKQHLVHAANKLALAGLVLLLLAMISALVLILDVTAGMGIAVILAAGMLTWFFTWWFILPVYIRLRHSAAAGVRGQSPHAHGQPHGAPVPRHATFSGVKSRSARL